MHVEPPDDELAELEEDELDEDELDEDELVEDEDEDFEAEDEAEPEDEAEDDDELPPVPPHSPVLLVPFVPKRSFASPAEHPTVMKTEPSQAARERKKARMFLQKMKQGGVILSRRAAKNLGACVRPLPQRSQKQLQ